MKIIKSVFIGLALILPLQSQAGWLGDTWNNMIESIPDGAKRWACWIGVGTACVISGAATLKTVKQRWQQATTVKKQTVDDEETIMTAQPDKLAQPTPESEEALDTALPENIQNLIYLHTLIKKKLHEDITLGHYLEHEIIKRAKQLAGNEFMNQNEFKTMVEEPLLELNKEITQQINKPVFEVGIHLPTTPPPYKQEVMEAIEANVTQVLSNEIFAQFFPNSRFQPQQAALKMVIQKFDRKADKNYYVKSGLTVTNDYFVRELKKLVIDNIKEAFLPIVETKIAEYKPEDNA